MINKIATQQQRNSISVINWFRLDNLIFAILGLVLSQAVILGEIEPFAPAVLGAISVWDKHKRWWVLGGTILGIIMTNGPLAWADLIILLLIFGTLHKQFLVSKQQWLVIPGFVMAIVFIVNGVFIIFGQGSLYGWVSTSFESLFAGLITLVTLTSLGAWEKRKRSMDLALEDKISCFIIGLGLILGLADLQIAHINIQSFVSRAAVLFAAFLGGPGGGAAIGTMVGLVPSVAGSINTASIGFYALAGLLGGIFKGLGRVGILIGFTLGNLMLSMYFAGQEQVIMTLIETALAGTVFLVFPMKYLEGEPCADIAENTNKDAQESSKKLEQMSQVFNELSKAFIPRQAKQEENQENPMTIMLNEVAEQVCAKCSLRNICWEKEFYKTYRSMVEVCSKAEHSGRLHEQNFSIDLQRRCMRLRELSVALMSQLQIFKQERYYQDKLLASQQVVSKQLAGMAELVRGYSKEVKYKDTSDEELAEFVKSHLLDDNIKVQNVKVIENGAGDKEIVIVQKACPEQNWCTHFIAPKISQILDRTYTVKETRCPTAGNKSCTYHLNPSKTYAVTTGVAMAIKDGSNVSGDNWSCLGLPNRKFAILLSDGMGAGSKACQESTTAINLLEQLLGAGLSTQMAVDTVNSVLLLRSTDETFATIDMAVVNEVSGLAEFIKIGACPSFIKRRTQVQPLKAKSLPVGILNQVNAEHIQYPVQVGDIIINMTDGVFEALSGDIDDWCGVIQALPQDDPQNIANYLIELARQSKNGAITDDLTVLVARIDYRSE